MFDVVYYLFNASGISTKPGRLMLPKWIKLSEKRFNEILSTVTEAKNNRFKTTTILLLMWKRYQIGQCLQEVKIKW